MPHKLMEPKDLPEDQRRIHEEEIEPAVQELEAILKKHGYVAQLTIQLEPVKEQESSTPDAIAMGATHSSRWLNAEPIMAFVESLNAAMKSGSLNNYNDLVEFLKQAQDRGEFAASPILTAIGALNQGAVDPMHVMMLAMQQNFEAKLTQEQAQVLTNALQQIERMGGTEASKRDVPDLVPHVEDGRIVGFENTKTGEVEYLDGLGGNDGKN